MQVSDPRDAAPRTTPTAFEAPVAAAARVSPTLQPYEWMPAPTTFQDAMQMCTLIANSDFAPKDYKQKPANVMIAIQMGGEIGLKPLQSVQGIAVIGGRPSVYGDTALAVVKRHPEYVSIVETLEGQGDNRVARCVATRRGEPPFVGEFSVAAAKLARLWGKDGPWTYYPERMLKMRARSFAIRDAFPDALKGLSIVEDVIDVEPAGGIVIAATTQPEPSTKRTEAVREALAKQVVDDPIAVVAPPQEVASGDPLPSDAIEQPAPVVHPGETAEAEPAAEVSSPSPATPQSDADAIQGSADRASAEYIVGIAHQRGLTNGGLRQLVFNVTGSARLTKKNAPAVLDALKAMPIPVVDAEVSE